eukprot:sb/3477483/
MNQYKDAKELLVKKRDDEERKRKKQLQAMSSSEQSRPSSPRSRPRSPAAGNVPGGSSVGPTSSTPGSPIPIEMIMDMLPSLDTLEQQDHDMLLNDLMGPTPSRSIAD